MNESELQQNFDTLAGRAKDKAAELAAVEAELSAIIGRLVDASSKERPAIITRRAELVNLRGVLADELKELESRRDSAELAIYLYREEQATAEARRLGDIAREAQKAVNAAADATMHFYNSTARSAATAESDKQRVELETNRARAIAESQIAKRNAEKAAALRDQAKAETAEIRAALGII